MLSGDQEGDKIGLIATSVLNNDEALAWRRQLGKDMSETHLGVGESPMKETGWILRDVERVLGDIDTNEDSKLGHARIPLLRMRARPL